MYISQKDRPCLSSKQLELLSEQGKKRDFMGSVLRLQNQECVFCCGIAISKIMLLAQLPNHQGWYPKWKLSQNMYTLHTHFCMFGTDLYA